jgi:hypothetical protein
VLGDQYELEYLPLFDEELAEKDYKTSPNFFARSLTIAR